MKDLPVDVLKDINAAVVILKKYGCSDIFLFGSMADRSFNDNSDIDIAVTGLKKSDFFKAYGELLGIGFREIDLIGLDYENDFSRKLKGNGKFERVA